MHQAKPLGVAEAPLEVVHQRPDEIAGERHAGFEMHGPEPLAVLEEKLAAVDRGLSSCWVGAFDDAAVAAAIGAQPLVLPVAILPLGHRAESAGRPARRPLSEVTTWL